MVLSTYLKQHPDDREYTAIPVGQLPGNPVGILLPNTKANWVSNAQNSIFGTCVYWSNPGIVGIKTSAKTCIAPGCSIAVKESGTGKILYGTVKDVILPATTIEGLCDAFYLDELGVSETEEDAQTVISQALGVSPDSAGIVGYVIEIDIGVIPDYKLVNFMDKVNDIDKIPRHGCYVY